MPSGNGTFRASSYENRWGITKDLIRRSSKLYDHQTRIFPYYPQMRDRQPTLYIYTILAVVQVGESV